MQGSRVMLALTSATALTGGLLTAVVAAPTAQAHGTMTDPASRIWACYNDYPYSTNDVCADAWAANPQALYDWMGVRDGGVAGAHESTIPDGQLCSAGDPAYAAFDVPTDQWPVTNLVPDADGKYTLTWTSTAPHATQYYRVYLSKPTYDPTKPLAWNDLEEVYESGPRARESTATIRLDLPERDGRQMLYTVWQRSDSPEAFYACSDVTLDGSGASTPTPTPTPAPTPEPTPTPMPDMPGMTEGITATTTISSDWGTGFCSNVEVSTTSTLSEHWRVDLPSGITITSLWNGVRTTQPDGTVSVGGAEWNHMITAGSPTSFGYCADRTAAPAPAPTPEPTPTTGSGLEVRVEVVSDWGSGRTVDVTVRNTGTSAIADWSVAIPWAGSAGSPWNAVGGVKSGVLTASNASWNGTLAAGASTTFGFTDTTASGLPSLTTCSALVGGSTVTCLLNGVLR
ncbi:MAG: lytic polysaccharide monooxygenase [Candidatus Nanopelagicales bacterium]